MFLQFSLADLGWCNSVGTKIWWIHGDLLRFSSQHGTTSLAEATSDVTTGSMIGRSSECHHITGGLDVGVAQAVRADGGAAGHWQEPVVLVLLHCPGTKKITLGCFVVKWLIDC